MHCLCASAHALLARRSMERMCATFWQWSYLKAFLNVESDFAQVAGRVSTVATSNILKHDDLHQACMLRLVF